MSVGCIVYGQKCMVSRKGEHGWKRTRTLTQTRTSLSDKERVVISERNKEMVVTLFSASSTGTVSGCFAEDNRAKKEPRHMPLPLSEPYHALNINTDYYMHSRV